MSKVKGFKNKKRDLTFEGIFKLNYILLFLYLLLYPFGNNWINGWMGRILIAVCTITVLYILFGIFLVKSHISIGILSVVFLLLSFLVSSGSAESTLKLVQGVVSFLFLVLFVDKQDYIKSDRSLLKYISRINVIVTIMFVIYANMPFAHNVYDDNIWLDRGALTLGYANPNAVGMMLFYFMAMNFVSVRAKIYGKRWGWIIACVYLYLVYKCGSRAALVCTILLVALILLKIKSIKKWIPIALFSLPISVISILPLLKSIGFMKNVAFLGENIYTGREEMYVEQMSNLKGVWQWLFGDLYAGSFTNYHNGILSVLVSTGLCGLIVFLIIWLKKLLPRVVNYNKVSYVAVCALIVLIVYSSFEAAFFLGTIPYGIMVVTLFVFSRYEEADYESSSH